MKKRSTGISAEKQEFRKKEEQIQVQRQGKVSFPLPSMSVSLGESGTGGKLIIPASFSEIQ